MTSERIGRRNNSEMIFLLLPKHLKGTPTHAT
jgi:hypothetical protein